MMKSSSSRIALRHLTITLATVLLAALPAFSTTFTVTKTDDTDDGTCDGDCSLREAISAANAAGGPDDITLPAGNYILEITGSGEDLNATGDLDITEDLEIQGDGAEVTIIDGAGDRIFDILSGIVQIADVTIQGGKIAGEPGGGVRNADDLTLTRVVVDRNDGDGGGGVSSSGGTLVLEDSTVLHNRSDSPGGGIGIVSGSAMISGSTVQDNRTNNADGAGLSNSGTTQIVNSTISGNRTSGNDDGGGISNLAGSLTLTNVTVSDNRVSGAGVGAGIHIGGGTVDVTNSIVADNDNNEDNCSAPVTTSSFNIDDDGSCGFVGTGDQSNVADARLGSLEDNGGPTATHALLAGSPAIDAGDTACPSNDQRGEPCADGDGDTVVTRDVGAYERSSLCTSVPAGGCVTATKGILVVKEKVAGKELVKAVLKKLSTPVIQSQFGDPVNGTTKYSLCIYAGTTNTLVTELLVDRAGALCSSGNPCWKAVSDKGYAFKDKDTASDGVKKILGKGGDAEKGKVIVKAKNNDNKGQTNLPTGIVAALQNSTQATVQVVTSDASCFSMVATDVKKDDGLIYKVKAP